VISDASCDEHGHESRVPLRLRGRVFWLLGQATRAAQRVTWDQLSGSGAGRGHYGVLASIDEFGPASQAEIGRRVGLDPSDMVAILNELEELGYVHRSQDPDDRRRNRVTLTPAGHDALARFDRAIGAAEGELLAPFSPAERAMLAALLERLDQRHDR
jgi:DNA-binding MarR family transcriptional regulator